jgi:trehalose-6-phosphatase
MALPFLDCGARRLDQIVQPGVMCVFNFDGTLAPVVAQSNEARTPLPILLKLVALTSHAPIAIMTGRSVADLQPRLGFVPEFLSGGADNKGEALEQLMQANGVNSAIYIGGDISDEDVFRLRRPDLLTIRVGLEPHSAAEFFLPHQSGILTALQALISKMREARIRNWMHAEPVSSCEI